MTTTSRRTKGAGSVFKDDDGVWHYRTELPPDPATGRRRRIETTGRNKTDTRDRHQAKIDRYHRDGTIPTRRSPYLRDWLTARSERRRAVLKPNTWYGQNCRVTAIVGILGNTRLADLTPAHIHALIDALADRDLSQSTINEHVRYLSQALDDAVLDELIPSNPCRRVKRPRPDERTVAVLDEHEPAALIRAATQTVLAGGARGPHDGPEDTAMWALMFELAFATGMREAERYALMPYELELRDGTPGIHVQQQLQDYVGGADASIPRWQDAEHVDGGLWLVRPKSAAGDRFVPISRSLWDRLWARIIAYGMHPRQFVFHNLRGTPLRHEQEMRRWRRALEAAGLPYVSIHSARHWAATRVAESGAGEDERKAVLGHTDIRMTARYTHWGAGALGDMMTRAIPDLAPTDDQS